MSRTDKQTSREDRQIRIRLPDELRRDIENTALEKMSSIQEEILVRIQRASRQDEIIMRNRDLAVKAIERVKLVADNFKSPDQARTPEEAAIFGDVSAQLEIVVLMLDLLKSYLETK